jgi:hypothetical protein
MDISFSLGARAQQDIETWVSNGCIAWTIFLLSPAPDSQGEWRFVWPIEYSVYTIPVVFCCFYENPVPAAFGQVDQLAPMEGQAVGHSAIRSFPHPAWRTDNR